MKRLILIWSIIISISIIGLVYHRKISNILTRFKIVEASQGYTSSFNNPLEEHLSAALCWKKYANTPLPVQTLPELHNTKYITLDDVLSTNTYSIGWMEHSVPVLYPEAHTILNQIGKDFADELGVRNLPKHKIRVTSLTRSIQSQKELSGNDLPSPHLYGYSFSISYQLFNKVNFFREDINGDLLKEALESVLKKYYEEKKILIHASANETFLSITLSCPAQE